MGKAIARKGKGRYGFKMLTGKSTGNRPLGLPKLRWQDYIRTNIKEICVNMRNCIEQVQNRDYWEAIVDAALNFGVT